LEQGSRLSTATTVIIILVVLAFVVLAAALGGILAQKYKKRRYRYYPAFKHTILEEDESTYSQSSTIARFGKTSDRSADQTHIAIGNRIMPFFLLCRQCAIFELF
jgi:hypothetical protein